MYQQRNENEIVVSVFPVGNCYHVSVHGLKIQSSIIIARSNRISRTELEIRFVPWIVIHKRVSYFTVFVYFYTVGDYRTVSEYGQKSDNEHFRERFLCSGKKHMFGCNEYFTIDFERRLYSLIDHSLCIFLCI